MYDACRWVKHRDGKWEPSCRKGLQHTLYFRNPPAKGDWCPCCGTKVTY